MKRRQFITLVGAVAAWPAEVRALEPNRIYRLGYLAGGASVGPYFAPFKDGMRDLGYVEGQNLTIEQRYAEGKFERLPLLVRDLLTVPIVMVAVADPVGVGLIPSLSRPGGNVTGVTNIGAELAGKRIEILKEIIPTCSKVAIFINPDDQNAERQMVSAKIAAERLAVRLDPILSIRSEADLRVAFEAALRARAEAVIRMIDPLIDALRKPTVALGDEYRLPVIYPFREDVLAGGLISYGTNLSDQYRQAATLVHKIFKGAKPADLPVEQPTKFELVINLKTAKALGVEVPTSLLQRADEVIE